MADRQGPLQLVLVTPERSVLDEPCDSVSLPATLGYVTILPRHTPLVSTLGIGVLSWVKGGARESVALAGGFFEVSEDTVTVLAETALRAQEIDVEATRARLEEARASLGQLSGPALYEARMAVQRAEAQLAVAGQSP